MRLVEFITDPSSKELSLSRFCLGIIVLIFWPICIIADFKGHKIIFWRELVGLTVAVAGIYAANSFGGAWASWKGEVKLPIIKGE